MKYFVTVLALLIAPAANAAEMPKELQGYWCNAQAVANGKYVRCKEDDAALTIEREMIVWEEGECQPLSIRNDGHPSPVAQRDLGVRPTSHRRQVGLHRNQEIADTGDLFDQVLSGCIIPAVDRVKVPHGDDPA